MTDDADVCLLFQVIGERAELSVTSCKSALLEENFSPNL